MRLRLLALALIICRVKALVFYRRFYLPTEAALLCSEVGATSRTKTLHVLQFLLLILGVEKQNL